MKLWLMRHGDAVRLTDDGVRPLSEEGRAEAVRSGLFLKRMNAEVSLIWHSTLRRSLETAALVARELGGKASLCEREGLRPEDDVENCALELAVHEKGDLLLVGHLPFLQILASLLLTGNEKEISPRWSTGALLCAERDGYGSWRLLHFITTKVMKLCCEK